MSRISGRYSFIFSLLVVSLCWCLVSLPLAQSASSSDDSRASKLQPSATANTPADPGRSAVKPDASVKRNATDAYGSLPLSFEANEGQSDAAVKFLARGNGYGFFLTSSGPVVGLNNATAKRANDKELSSNVATDRSAVVSFELIGSSRSTRIAGVDPLPGKANYFSGNDPAKWKKNISTYQKVRYAQVYPGIDAIYYGNQRQLEYDFIVAPTTDPSQIKLRFTGADATELDSAGNLILRTAAGDMTHAKPVAYQEIAGVRREVAAAYRLNKGVVSFNLGKYDKSQPLIIDPVLVYSSFFGGSLGELADGIAIDSQGNAYITGRTVSHDLPIVGGVQATKGSADNFTDAFVVKVNPTGNGLLYSTYLGGTVADEGHAIKVDDQGNAYVAGFTSSANFPTTAGSLQTTKSALTDGFVTKLNSSGSALVYSTYLGGDDQDQISGLAIGTDNSATVVGTTHSSRFSSNLFPTPRGGSPAYKTIDSANHWVPSGTGLGANAVNRFAIEAGNSNNVYAATSAGLYKSVDAGANWSLLANGIAVEFTHAVVIDPSNSSVVYAATDSGVYKSSNGGALFERKAQGLFNNTLAIDPATPATIYAGGGSGLFKSTNGGDTWSEVFYGSNAPQSPTVTEVVIDPTNHTTVYVGTVFGIYKTTSGNGWMDLNSGPLAGGVSITALAIDPTNPSVLYAGITNIPNVVKTTNGGTTWTSADIHYTVGGVVNSVQVNGLAIDPIMPSTLYAATYVGGLFKSTDGGANWTQSNTGLGRLNLNTVAVDPNNPATLFTGAIVVNDAFAARINASGSALQYLRNFGGDADDSAFCVALDANNNAYIGGGTGSANFPVLNALQPTATEIGDAFIAKLTSGGDFVYSTFLGGNSDERVNGIAVRDGNAYVVGRTFSTNFPLVNALKSTLAQNDGDAFVAKLNTSGSALEFSTYLGGGNQDEGLSIGLDSLGNVYVAGYTESSDFPTQSATQAYGGSKDAFVTELTAGGNQLVYSTYLGGSGSDQANAIAVDSLGAAYVTGNTSSNNFPTVNPYQATRKGNDAFFAKIGSASSLATNVQLSQATYQVNENGLGAQLTVTRTGHVAGETTVNYTTSDSATGNCSTVSGKASSKCDYEATFGTLHFSAGEASKTIYVPIVDDAYAEGNETFTVSLLGATGASISSPGSATVTIVDNESVNGPNPIDNANFFVRQHYIDFLNREPDAPGLAFWANQITECQQPGATCNATVRRINVSAAFFLSIEFQETGYLVERLYKASYGDATGTSNFGPTHTLSVPIVRLNEFLPDSQEIGRGLVVGNPGWEQVLENNKVAFINQFVLRSRFQTSYSALLTPAQFVDQLFAHAGVTPTAADRTAAINEFGGAADSANNAARARALRRVAENSTLNDNEKNRAFVLMQYFGYLRRNPNDPQDTDYSGYDFWLSKLNQFNGNFVNADMVQAFIDSGEYRARFGP